MAHALRRGGRFEEALGRTARRSAAGSTGHRGAVANQLENIAYVQIEPGGPSSRPDCWAPRRPPRGGRSQHGLRRRARDARSVERLRSSLSPEAFDTAWAAGRSLSQADAVALAVAA